MYLCVCVRALQNTKCEQNYDNEHTKLNFDTYALCSVH